MKQGIRNFFKYARARHQIYLNRAAGMPREKWTKDPILSQYRFTNVFRELDKTTVWFAKNVRDPRRNTTEVMLATVVFRLLNRIEVGEAVFMQTDLETMPPSTAFERFAQTGDVSHLKHAIITMFPKGPHVTGAYIISSPAGYTKLDGVLEVIRRFYHESREWKGLGAGIIDTMNWNGEEGAAALLLANRGEDWCTLEKTWDWLKQFDYFGPFHAYEIVTDLRHTILLGRAPDIMTWANPGPGARRGANRVMGRDKNDKSAGRAQLIEEMQSILLFSRDTSLWPRVSDEWPVWEMREVEHTLCEFDKFERVRNGQGTPRGVYR